MTTDDYHPLKATDKSVDDLYRVAVSMEEKVDDILDELRDLTESCGSHAHRHYNWDDCQDDENHY